jgi:hypothetical protein
MSKIARKITGTDSYSIQFKTSEWQRYAQSVNVSEYLAENGAVSVKMRRLDGQVGELWASS